mgnify:CR=1 FL=1
MKKLIALFAVSTLASTSAIAGIALSGTASVSYDDNGSLASSTTHDADLTITGTSGGTTLTASYDMEGASLATTAVDMTTTIGPISVTADMHDVDESNVNDGDGDPLADSNDQSVAISLDAPVGDVTIGLDDSGDLTASGTFAGVSVSVTMGDTDSTTASASIAGMDITLTNDAGATEWTIGTTVAGTAVTLGSDKSVSATFGVTGNTVVVSHTSERAAVTTATATTKHTTAQKDAYTTVAVSRALTSGATLAATYNTFDSSLTLKASVAF